MPLLNLTIKINYRRVLELNDLLLAVFKRLLHGLGVPQNVAIYYLNSNIIRQVLLLIAQAMWLWQFLMIDVYAGVIEETSVLGSVLFASMDLYFHIFWSLV